MAKHAHSRDLHVRVEYGELMVHLVAEGVSYSPDALDDMKSKAVQAFTDAWKVVEPYERFAATVFEPFTDEELSIEDLVDEEHED